MGIKKATTKVFTDYRRKRKDDKYPIKLRVTYKGGSHEYALGLFITEEEDKIIQSKKFGKKDVLKKIYNSSIDQLSRANRIIDALPVFNRSSFERDFLITTNSLSSNSSTTLVDLLMVRSDEKRKEGSISYSDSFKTTANAIKSFNHRLLIEDVDGNMLVDFEKHLLEKGNSNGTIGVYMRNLRTAFNQAIKDGIVREDSYPFGMKKYCIPQQRNNKTAIGMDEIMKIFNYNPIAGSSQEKARDFWVFMYLTNGLNMKDVCLLKYSNLKPDVKGVNFFRAKTNRTKKHNKVEIEVWYDADGQKVIKEIIFKYANKDRTDSYLFPILHDGVSPTDERRLIQNFTRFVNKNMEKVSKSIGLTSVPKTNVARHTFVTTIINEGNAPLTAIKDLVGHSSIATTAGYVSLLPIEKRKEYAGVLMKK